MSDTFDPSAIDPFALLGVARRFDVDSAELHKRFIAAVSEHHPDRFSDPLDQADAAQRSAQVNEAYNTLRDPEQRANVLLRLLGGATKEEDNSLPPTLLMEMMETREEMEEAIESGDTEQLNKLRAWADNEREQHLQKVAQLFDQAAAKEGDARQGDLKAIRLELNAMRYIERMIEQMPDDAG